MSAPPWGPPNPFATRHLRPGALPFIGEDVCALARRVERGGSFEIVGPHGTGKSTLVRALAAAIGEGGRAVSLLVVRADGGVKAEHRPGRGRAVHFVDGFGELGPFARAWQALRAQLGGGALVVTAHAPQGFSPLYQTAVDGALAEQVAAVLLERSGSTLVRPGEARDALRARAGNLREALFDLYDMHEVRARSSGHAGGGG